jgi:hypothetical protein
MDVDDHLSELSRKDFRSAAEGLAALAVLTGEINTELAAHSKRLGLAPGDVPDKLEEWISRLEAIAADIARQFSALSYSVGVSFPVGVSVSIAWSPGG